MPTKKRSVAASTALGRELAEVSLKRRKGAARSRKAAIEALPKKSAVKSASATVRAGRSVGILIAEGDSWFDYPFNDVLKHLEDKHGYDIESVAHAGDRVEDMAYSGGQLDAFIRQIEKLLRRGDVPRAILLSGGGNDIVGEFEFAMMLNHASSTVNGLNAQIVDGVVNQRLYDAYATILSAVSAVCQATIGKKIPILVHGYDYPVPDGRGVLGGWWRLPGPWIEPGFRQKGYSVMNRRKELVKKLIDQFNAMLQLLTSNQTFSHVLYVDLRNTLSSSTDYEDDWANELHPTGLGFASITAKFATALART